MTTAISGLVLVSIVASIAIVSGTIYLNLRSEALAKNGQQLLTDLKVAATILEKRISGSKLEWSEDGTMGSFQTRSIPPFYDTSVIDSVTRVIGEAATVYAIDARTNALAPLTTSMVDPTDGGLAALAIPPEAPIYSSILAGETFIGEIALAGQSYYGALEPIHTFEGEVMGAIFVGTPKAEVEAAANSVVGLIGMVGGAVTAIMAVIGIFASRSITRPVPKLESTMDVIARGNFDVEVPFTDQRNEVGGMARAVEVFRANGLRVSQMTEAEAARIIADAENRRNMMDQLQQAFGRVVDAAIAGDFSRHVDVEFPDDELNSLAASVNNLVSTFRSGVADISVVLSALAEADLTQRMTGEHEGAFAQLQNDVNAVADKLADVIGRLRRTSGSLKTATGEILSGANDLSERTTRQAATIEQTSAAMEQLAATVVKNAQRAHQASDNANQVTRAAEQSGEVMDATMLAMDRITQSSAKISNIIGMIDDIAFQTNLLALNASVEAARAGDAGKGFAVVAVEVRRLAQSAAQASSEVKSLIEQSTAEVNSGSGLVSQAAGKLRAVLDAARGNGVLLDGIANDSREQAYAIEEVTAGVRTMDEMTQHNAALVEETNAAIEQTEAQATELDRVVEIFRLMPGADTSSKATSISPKREEPKARPPKPPRSQGNLAISDDWNEF
ncbi:hypothetical protein ASG47_07090 [Devosia sp. Leaf420]|uniref:methyl-accepting chemotaxis protein n=1 Tax=Devosia sp. Leaf420 TaxID=1736374 RepID=UPI0007142403|nr:methyl-accepting chemotaxis protein [Devosia sp. Leaf420]KQT48131.1 hypothetical protein ASG47_07090 [Devosia sp. Leaf420]